MPPSPGPTRRTVRSTRKLPPASTAESKMKQAANPIRITAVHRMRPIVLSVPSGKMSAMYQLRLDDVMVRPIEPW